MRLSWKCICLCPHQKQISYPCVCVCVCVTQLCPNPCNPMNCSPPYSFVHGILHERILECIAMPFSRGSSWPRDWTQVSCISRQILDCLSHGGSPYSLTFMHISSVNAMYLNDSKTKGCKQQSCCRMSQLCHNICLEGKMMKTGLFVLLFIRTNPKFL